MKSRLFFSTFLLLAAWGTFAQQTERASVLAPEPLLRFVANGERDTPFALKRADLWRVPGGTNWLDRGLDFSWREVRVHVLARFERELNAIAPEARGGGVTNVVEIDWVAGGPALKPDVERDNAKHLRDFMARARLAFNGFVKRRNAASPAANHEPRTTNHEPRTTNHEPRTTNHEPRTTNHEIWRLCVRVPGKTTYEARHFGYDAEQWKRDGLADGAVCADASFWKGTPANVPPLLVSRTGERIASAAQWEQIRRPELLDLFLTRMYGVRPPEAENPPTLRFEQAEPDKTFAFGAVRKRVKCVYGGKYGETNFTFTAFIPRQNKPAPAFVLICNRDPKENLDPERVKKSGFWPVEEIVARGYAAIAFFNGDVTPDYSWDFERGVFGVFQKPEERDGKSWAVLSAWAWGASRVMDWIETEPTLDARHVGVVGHSRGGKTALLAGVTDTRFAMTCSNCSGCGGAKLNHVDLPASEHLDQILDAIGCWFCGDFAPWRGREREMDFDQHQWAALVAPRLLAVASASEDDWAGQEGEFATCAFASPAWELYGKKGLVGDAFPGPDKPLQDGCISYHERTGIHNLTPYDWARYMDFADRHGWKKAE